MAGEYEHWCSSQDADSNEISLSCKKLWLDRCKKYIVLT